MHALTGSRVHLSLLAVVAAILLGCTGADEPAGEVVVEQDGVEVRAEVVDLVDVGVGSGEVERLPLDVRLAVDGQRVVVNRAAYSTAEGVQRAVLRPGDVDALTVLESPLDLDGGPIEEEDYTVEVPRTDGWTATDIVETRGWRVAVAGGTVVDLATVGDSRWVTLVRAADDGDDAYALVAVEALEESPDLVLRLTVEDDVEVSVPLDALPPLE